MRILFHSLVNWQNIIPIFLCQTPDLTWQLSTTLNSNFQISRETIPQRCNALLIQKKRWPTNLKKTLCFCLKERELIKTSRSKLCFYAFLVLLAPTRALYVICSNTRPAGVTHVGAYHRPLDGNFHIIKRNICWRLI